MAHHKRRKSLTNHHHARHTSLAPSMLIEAKDSPSWCALGWRCFSYTITCWAPSCLLSWLGWREREVRQAWREKITLCLVILLLCGVVAFLTFALGLLLCPSHAQTRTVQLGQVVRGKGLCIIRGGVYNATEVSAVSGVPLEQLVDQDASDLFLPNFDSCLGLFQLPLMRPCQLQGGCIPESRLNLLAMHQRLVFDYDEIGMNRTIFNGKVYDLNSMLTLNLTIPNLALQDCLGNDCTMALAIAGEEGAWIGRCLNSRFLLGELKRASTGCLIFNIIVSLMLIVVGALIVVKFVMAVAFSWFLSRQLDRMKQRKISEMACQLQVPDLVKQALDASLGQGRAMTMSPCSATSDEPFVLILVTCYSEGEEALRATLDSIAQTDYHDGRKLLLIIADGLVTGEGNWASTPELLLRMLQLHPLESAQSSSSKAYRSIGEGWKASNEARVVVGHYPHKGRLQPVCLVVKCGSKQEQQSQKKPGNRGKRDSQILLMSFLQRCLFNEAMTPLDYELFNKIYWLMGCPPDSFEMCLMVDADTRIAPDSLTRMVNAMRRDSRVMGLCGETRIANKTQSWVTSIQVFEYYISHHLGKAFESVFGGVTCLPGCFCMYRIYARCADGRLVPILTNPMVIEEYSQSRVDTLHKKNLLLLGEDRFLTTLMLKSFPKRRMIFVPTAWCKTTVPSSFGVLLSQRRRWINSTLHNLVELVLVRNLCGIFCFSMQFVIFLELIGTVILPAAIVFTGVLIVKACLDPRGSLIPLALLAMVLGLPAILIVLTTRRLIYVLWMLIYLLSLPIWNFVLPLYAYWHFDDFSWGQTRPVQDASGNADVQVEPPRMDVPMRTWLSWTRLYLK